MNKLLKCVLGCITIFWFGSCSESYEKMPTYDVVAAPEWDALFKRDSGWFGGDGIFAIPLTGIEHRKAGQKDSTVFLFSDTMIGEIKEDSLFPGYHMVNNSIGVLYGADPVEEKISYHIHKSLEGQDQTLFVPKLAGVKDNQYYWLGDGFVDQYTGKMHIFAYLIENHPEYEVFGFDVEGAALISFPKNDPFPFLNQEQRKLPFFFKHDIQRFGAFGAAVVVNTKEAGAPNPDEYIYIYGVNDPDKQLMVSRVPSEEFEDLSRWTFWDGRKWSSDYKQSAAITSHVSNELSITFLADGNVLLVSQVGTLGDSDVGIRVGESLTGPFGPIVKIWTCDEAIEEPEFFAYNAKAHPSLSGPGELLISYNVNSLAFWDQIESYPHLYRPRFIKMIFND